MKRSAKDRGRVTAPRDRTPTIITALIVMIVVVISLAAGFAILRERRLSVRETERSTANLARTLEEHSRLTFEAVIQSLRTGAKYIDETPDALRLGNRKTEEALRYLVNAVPYLSDLKVADHNGRLVADVFNQKSLGKNFSHRTTFHLLRDDPSRPFVVSEAENSAKYGGWVIFVSIPLLSPAGKFRGVVVGALNVSHFNRFYEAINVGKYGAIKLVRRDGVILTRRPEGFIGKSMAKGPLFVEYIPKSPVGTIDVVAATNGLRRILSYRALPHIPVVVVVSASRDEILAPWRERTAMTVAFALALIAAIVGLLFLFLRAHRNQVAENLERQRVESQFFNAIENVREGVALYDADDRLVVCNGTYRNQWNCGDGIVAPGERFETILRKAVDKGTVHLSSGKEDDTLSEILSSHRRPGPAMELLCGERWLLLHEDRLPDGGLIQITPDITDLKVRERECRVAMEEAEQANAAKSRFLEAANHDLRQPLQSLSLLSHALLMRPDDAPKGIIIDNMRYAIDAMEAVLNGLLDIGKFESGRIVPQLTTFALKDMFRRLEAEFALLAQSLGVELRVVATSLNVHSDFDLLGRVVENFLSNAIRYTESGRILVGARRRGDRVRIEIWDTGVGIPEDQLGLIFEEFYQLRNPARNQHKGFGLGLSIVDRIARLIGTPIDVRSTPGKGSMFAVTVPLGSGNGAPLQEPAQVQTAAPISSRILLIEDDEAVLEATRMVLEGFGAQVDGVLSASDALGLIEGQGCRPDLIVTDHRLPGGETGVDLLRRINEAMGCRVPGLIITGDTSDAQMREAQRAGYEVFRKPVDPEKLKEFIGDALAS